MTLPVIINNTKNKQLETALKKEASVISQALQLVFTDSNMDYSPNYFGSYELRPKLLQYLKYANNCEILHSDKNCITQTDLNYTTLNGKKSVVNRFLDDGQIILADGSMIFMENAGLTMGYYSTAGSDETKIPADGVDKNVVLLFISVDVNGYSKGPNKLGHDLFTFQITQKGLQPMGAEGTLFTDDKKYCSDSSNDSLNGISCTYKALHEKDYFKNLH